MSGDKEDQRRQPAQVKPQDLKLAKRANALRENLRKRKTQQKEREQDTEKDA